MHAAALQRNRSFGSAERLVAALGLEPGVVSPFGLIALDRLGVEYRTIKV
ncbi:hypothetical protein L1I79_29185 [Strepomyces sp. STD 3.1]|nr:hypothetical protein [Streptomyces sp. STD 3.1]